MIKIEFAKILMTLINFVILVLILKYFFWNKIKSIIDERQKAIDNNITQAEEDAQRARKLRLDNEKTLKSVKEEGKKLREEQKQKADKIYQEIVDNAHKEAETILGRARIEIGREEEKAKYELKKETIDLAIKLSEKALEETVDEKKHRELIDSFISKVGI